MLAIDCTLRKPVSPSLVGVVKVMEVLKVMVVVVIAIGALTRAAVDMSI